MKQWIAVLCGLVLLVASCNMPVGNPARLPGELPEHSATEEAGTANRIDPAPSVPTSPEQVQPAETPGQSKERVMLPNVMKSGAAEPLPGDGSEGIPPDLEQATQAALPPVPAPESGLRPLPLDDPWVERQLKGMDLTALVGQVFLPGIGVGQTEFDSCSLVEDLRPAGLFFETTNVFSPEQLREMIAAYQECADAAGLPPLLMSMDHEGEYVYRFKEGGTMFPAAVGIAATGEPANAYHSARAGGGEVAYTGVKLILGPGADVLIEPDNEVVAMRTFGSDPQAAASFVASAIQGYREAGLIPVIKHFPGHGGVSEDSHRRLPVDSSDRSRLDAYYLPTFRRGIEAGAQVVMLAHIAFPALTGTDEPASLSPEIVALLRNDLGFDGVIMTDDLNMRGATGQRYDPAETAVLAVRAGVNLVLFEKPDVARQARDLLVGAARDDPSLREQIVDSARRILALKAANGLTSFPVLPAEQPDWDANAVLNEAIGRQSVALFQASPGLLPLTEGTQHILVVGPNAEWDFYNRIESALEEQGISVDVVNYSLPEKGRVAETNLPETLPAQVSGYDRVLVLTYQAHLDRVTYGQDWQTRLVNGLLDSGKPVVVVALKSPADLLDFPTVPAYLATYGTTRGALAALLDILVNGVSPVGQPLLPERP